jgi:hypothetical protein
MQRRTLVFFAIAHTLPLSLGLTSLLGYLFGITYVLPFHLGSQMAVHTAFAFALYSAAMLVYAWRHIPQTQEGLPKWTPAMAVVMVPVFLRQLKLHSSESFFIGASRSICSRISRHGASGICTA